tara:strand:- start:1215 stop:2288 length:1074 start_codon:yes stop_codon:yes gene_type:complete
MKIITVIGARPQFIKAAMLSKQIANSSDISEIVIHTGQHFDRNMSEIFFEEMKIPKPDYNLGICSMSHGAMTGRQLEEIEKILLDEEPDFVLVYGDTNSTLAGALAAAKLNIKIAHVEAGLRSYNKKMPEEINRILTDHLSAIHFTPTKSATNNLINEGISKESIINVGDIMFDAALYYEKMSSDKSKILEDNNLKNKDYILATIHRQENTDNINNLNDIISALSFSNKKIVLPVHPRTQKIINENKISAGKNLIFISPVGYLDMISLEKNAYKIVTDSGGVQKEAYFHNVPCITLREETEWVELVEIGANEIVGTDYNLIKKALEKDYPKFNHTNPYGDGTTAKKITETLISISEK